MIAAVDAAKPSGPGSSLFRPAAVCGDPKAGWAIARRVIGTEGVAPSNAPRANAASELRGGSMAQSIAPRTDLADFNAMLKGELSIEDGMRRIAISGGWPMRTPTGLLFAHPIRGGATPAIASELNGWRPQAMERRGELAFLLVPFNEERAFSYKLVVGGEYRADPWARSYNYDENGEISFTRPPRDTHFERWPEITDGSVKPRELRVFVPRGGATHLLFAQDGQNLFDPQAMHGGWKLQHSAPPKMMIVGIDNTDARFDEYGHTRDAIGGGNVHGGKGDEYADFVNLSLRPFIESRYGKAKKHGLLGSSLGGLISYNIAQRAPADQPWDFAGSMSGTFAWGKMKLKNETMIERYEGVRPGRTVYYLDSGGGPGEDNYDPTNEMKRLFERSGFEHGRNLFHWYEAGAEHDEAAWAARVHRPLRVFAQT